MSKQIYAVCCYTCEHNGQETCKGCNTILNGENEPYEKWQLRDDLCQKDKQIADLQHKLKVAERATEWACKELNRNFIGIELDEKYFNIARERIENTNTQIIKKGSLI